MLPRELKDHSSLILIIKGAKEIVFVAGDASCGTNFCHHFLLYGKGRGVDEKS